MITLVDHLKKVGIKSLPAIKSGLVQKWADGSWHDFFQERLTIEIRDENNNPVMGAFGSMTSEKIYFRIIDCTIYDIDACSNNNLTKALCKWEDSITIQTCNNEGEIVKTYDDICFPSNYPPNQDCN